MLPSSTLPALLHSLLFQLTDAMLAVQPAMSCTEPQTAQTHLLLICTGGSGGLTLPGGTTPLSADRCFLLSPGTTYTAANPETTLYYYQLSFNIYQIDGRPGLYTRELLPGRQELLVHPFTRVIRLAEELTACPDNRSEIQLYRQQLKFQELLLLLLEHNYPDEAPSPAESVEGTIRYMQEHYMDSITVKQLAEQAGVSLWQYTPLFQKLTGQKPLEYLTGLRISRSQQLLLESAEPLREIARLTGFSDEYYFSRRFRQITGVTPGQYAMTQRGKVTVQDWTGHTVDIPERPKRVIYHGETIGDLLALGVKPVGGDEEFARNSVYKHRLKSLANVGFPLNPQLTASLRPDLIIIANSDEKLYKRVADIAPALTFDSFAPLEQRMRTLGGWLGNQRHFLLSSPQVNFRRFQKRRFCLSFLLRANFWHTVWPFCLTSARQHLPPPYAQTPLHSRLTISPAPKRRIQFSAQQSPAR